MAARARTREVLRPDRGLAVEARSPPDQMDCFSSPAPRWLLGSRTVVLLALLVIYNDESCRTRERNHYPSYKIAWQMPTNNLYLCSPT